MEILEQFAKYSPIVNLNYHEKNSNVLRKLVRSVILYQKYNIPQSLILKCESIKKLMHFTLSYSNFARNINFDTFSSSK